MKTELLAWLLNATAAVSLACIAVLILRKPLQRMLGAEVAYRLWIVVPLAAILAYFSLPVAAPVAVINGSTVSVAAPIVIAQASSILSGLDADRWLLAVWLSGVVALCVLLAVQQRRFVSRLGLWPGADGSWRSSLRDASPAVLGVLRQKLVLPDCFEAAYDSTEQQLVIAHERMHQQRRDPWALAICAGLRTLFWFNPLVHVAAVRFRRDIELACDAAVLRQHPASRQRYANALLKTHIANGALPIGCQWENTPPMKERIMLLRQALPARHSRIAGAILGYIASLGIAGFALAGHETALQTANALAAPTAELSTPPSQSVQSTQETAPRAKSTSAVDAIAPMPMVAPLRRTMTAPQVALVTRSHASAVVPGSVPPPPPPPPPQMFVPPPPPPGMRPSDRAAPPAPPAPPSSMALRAPPAPPARAGFSAPPAPPPPPRFNAPVRAAQVPPPHYPDRAVKNRVGGQVMLKILVGKDGSAKHVEVVSARPQGVFDQSTVDAAKQWHFTPGTDAQGNPQEGYVMVPVTFAPDKRAPQASK